MRANGSRLEHEASDGPIAGRRSTTVAAPSSISVPPPSREAVPGAAGSPPRSSRGGPTRRSFADPGGLLLLCVVCAFVFLLPVVMLIYGAFRSADPGQPGHWQIQQFIDVYTSVSTYHAMGNSLALSAVVVTAATAVACYFALIVSRTKLALARWITPVFVAAFAIPSLFFALSWGMLGQHPSGLLNEVIRIVTSSNAAPINAQSWLGLGFVEILKTTALEYLLLLGPIRALDGSLHEAGLMSGAGRWRSLLTLELPVLKPALGGTAIFGFIVTLGALDAPLLLGQPAGLHTLSLDIYGAIATEQPSNYAKASARSIALMVIVLVLVVIHRRIMAKGQFGTIGGKSYRPAQWTLRRSEAMFARTAIIALVLLLVILPLGALVLASVEPYFGVYHFYTWSNYATVLGTQNVKSAFTTTAVVGVIVGLVASVLAVLVSVAADRSRSRLRTSPENMVWLLRAIPGVTVGVGVIWGYLSVPGLSSLYATIWIVLIGLIALATPAATRAVGGAVVQVSAELEEAARMSGARRVRAFMSVVVPLITPSFVMAWAMTALLAATNLEIPLLLGSATNQTVSLLAYNSYSQGVLTQAAAIFCLFIASLMIIYGILGGALLAYRRVSARDGLPVGMMADPSELSDSRGETFRVG